MKFFALVVCLGLAVTPAAFAMKVNVDWDHDVDFSNYKTYTYIPTTPIPNPLMDKRVVEALESELGNKGFTKVDSSPDMVVTYTASHKEQKTYVTDGYGYGYGPGWRWGGGMGVGTVSEFTIEEGTIVVDMHDAKSKQMLFRGSATDTISQKSEKNAKKIQKAMKKLFKKFPPENN